MHASSHAGGRHGRHPTPACGQLGSRMRRGTGPHRQKMWASSCWKRRTRVRPCSAPLNSLRCSTPKSARRSGSSRYDRLRLPNMRQWPARGWRAGVQGGPPRVVCTKPRGKQAHAHPHVLSLTEPRALTQSRTRAVHRLQAKLRLLHAEREHVLAAGMAQGGGHRGGSRDEPSAPAAGSAAQPSARLVARESDWHGLQHADQPPPQQRAGRTGSGRRGPRSSRGRSCRCWGS